MDKVHIFLGTNIVIDFFDGTRKNHQAAKLLIEKLIVDNYQIVISEDMLSTIAYILKWQSDILLKIKIIQKKWVISKFGDKVIGDAIDLSIKNKLDFEDVMQCLCAKENNCEYLITSDNQFYDCGLNICTAEKFLKWKAE